MELKTAPFAFGVCVYGIERPDGSLDLCCTDGAAGPRCWNWKQFRFLDTRLWAEKLHADLLAILAADKEVSVLGVSDDFPLE